MTLSRRDALLAKLKEARDYQIDPAAVEQINRFLAALERTQPK